MTKEINTRGGIGVEFYRDIKNLFFGRRDDVDLAIGEAFYVVIDTELTGLDLKRDSIISIGAIRMSGTGIDLGKTFHRLVRPSSDMKPESIVIHGITPSELMQGSPLQEVLSEFLNFLSGDIIVGHFISLDMHILNREIKRIYGYKIQNPCIDTNAIYRWIKENGDSFSRHYEDAGMGNNLFSIAREFAIPVQEAHNALSDAFMAAQIFQRFLRILPGLGVRRVKELLRIGRP